MSSQLGSRYVLGEVVGRGGMGEVRRATTLDGETVAIKVLKPEFSTEPKVVERFLQERAILCSFQHDNLVKILDLIVEGDDVGIVMELVEGGDLRKYLKAKGTLPPAQAFEIAAQVLDALTIVHTGVVHRDIKPENILIPDGTPIVAKLSDFGVAAMLDDTGVATTHTSVIGTPYYMSPEAGRGKAVASSDLYSVGCLLYELIAGTPPFTGQALVVLQRHTIELPQPIADLPVRAWNVIEHLMQKQPSNRPTDAAAALDEVRSCIAELEGIAAMPKFEPGEGTFVRSLDSLIGLDGQVADERLATGDLPVQPGARSRRGVLALAGALVLVLAVLVGVLVTGGGGGAADQDTAPVTYAFTPTVQSDGLVMTREWIAAGGDASRLQERIRLVNATDRLLDASFDQVVPKSIAAHVDDLVFSPEPDEVIEEDPIVRYYIEALEPGHFVEFAYEAALDADEVDADLLEELADAQASSEAAYRDERDDDAGAVAALTLASLVVEPGTLEVRPGDQYPLNPVGVMSDGSTAPSLILTGLSWSSSAPNVAVIDDALVTAVSPGTATITAQAGDLTARVQVTVVEADAPVSSTTRPAAPTYQPPVLVQDNPPAELQPIETTTTTRRTVTASTTSTTRAATATSTTTTEPTYRVCEDGQIVDYDETCPSGTTSTSTSTSVPDDTTTTSTTEPTTTSSTTTTTTTTAPTTTTTAPTTTTTTAPTTTTTAAPQRSVSVSKGASAQGQPGCSSSACRFITVSYSNFGGGSHTVVCHASNAPSFYTYSTSSSTSSVCYYGFGGQQVWATVDGQASPKVTW